jgi:SAM-dependent methyltransferase
MKQYSPSFERNRQPITDVLKNILPDSGRVLEIASGSGQHICWFAENFPKLVWQPSDLAENLPSIDAWSADMALDNVQRALAIDLHDPLSYTQRVDVIICINTIHIVDWRGVQCLFEICGRQLAENGLLYVYGPYRYSDRELEPSNQQFDRWLKQRDLGSGIREFDAVAKLANSNGLALVDDIAMPSNNRSIWWRKVTPGS